MTRKISDFTDADRRVVETALKERYGGHVAVEPAECVTTTLRLQADHEKDRAGVASGKTGRDLAGC
ncbi:MAG: hypothetical protein HY322_20315 [Betaproteobacteria bacterium]|nr:hypothetical protein [Betaproteobacteria bacterium]